MLPVVAGVAAHAQKGGCGGFDLGSDESDAAAGILTGQGMVGSDYRRGVCLDDEGDAVFGVAAAAK